MHVSETSGEIKYVQFNEYVLKVTKTRYVSSFTDADFAPLYAR